MSFSDWAKQTIGELEDTIASLEKEIAAHEAQQYLVVRQISSGGPAQEIYGLFKTAEEAGKWAADHYLFYTVWPVSAPYKD